MKLSAMLALMLLCLTQLSQASTNAQQLTAKYAGRRPTAWGFRAPGVCTQLPTKEKVIALTFDACGGSHKGNGFDKKLIEYLEREHIPATLFLSGRWIDANPQIVRRLAENPLFEIENHGLHHKPCSIDGRSAYGIHGTKGVQEVIDEVEKNAEKIESLTHHRPRFYRAGTAMYDEVAASVVLDLGYIPTSFTISGDGGATFSAEKIKARLSKVTPGAIILCHMNHPEGKTADGIKAAIPILRKQGFKFVKLEDADGLPGVPYTRPVAHWRSILPILSIRVNAFPLPPHSHTLRLPYNLSPRLICQSALESCII